MWYKVSRISGTYEDTPPCEEAVRKSFPVYQVRGCKSFEEYDKRFGSREGTWLSKGTEHVVTKEGWISRRLDDEECFAINIKTLKQLQEFIGSYGEIVLSEDRIEIYDNYRE